MSRANMTYEEHILTNFAESLGLTGKDLGVNDDWWIMYDEPHNEYYAVSYGGFRGSALGCAVSLAKRSLKNIAAKNATSY